MNKKLKTIYPILEIVVFMICFVEILFECFNLEFSFVEGWWSWIILPFVALTVGVRFVLLIKRE